MPLNDNQKREIKTRYETYRTWLDFKGKFIETPNSSDLRGKVASQLHRVNLVGVPADIVDRYIIDGQKSATTEVKDFVKPNLGDIVDHVVDKSSEGNLNSYLLNVKPYQIKDNTKHNEIVKDHVRILKAKETIGSNDLGLIVEELSKLNPKFVDSINYHAQADPSSVIRSYQGIVEMDSRALVKHFTKEEKDGKVSLDKDKIKGYIKANLRATPDNEKDAEYIKLIERAYELIQH